jgi:transposase
VIGLDLEDLAVDGCITKAPCGGEVAGRSPVDRGKQGLKRSTVTDGAGVPLHLVAAGANRHDAPLLGPSLEAAAACGYLIPASTVHLDRGYAGKGTVAVLDDHGLVGVIAQKGLPAPLQVGRRWVVERTQAWMNGYGKLRRCTEKQATIVRFYLALAAAVVVTRCLIREARPRYRWPGRPTTRRLK